MKNKERGIVQLVLRIALIFTAEKGTMKFIKHQVGYLNYI